MKSPSAQVVGVMLKKSSEVHAPDDGDARKWGRNTLKSLKNRNGEPIQRAVQEFARGAARRNFMQARAAQVAAPVLRHPSPLAKR